MRRVIVVIIVFFFAVVVVSATSLGPLFWLINCARTHEHRFEL
jgi:hypothetical protein